MAYDGADELRLCVCIGLSVVGMLCGQVRLKSFVASCELGLQAQRITELELLTPDVATVDDNVEVMCSVTVGPSHEPLAVGQCSVEVRRRRVPRTAKRLNKRL